MVRRIDDSTTAEFFPKVFSNEIYYSKTSCFMPFRYVTNLTIKYVHTGQDNYQVDNHVHKLTKSQYLILNSGNEVTCFSGSSCNEGMSIFMDSSILFEVNSAKKNIETVFDLDEKSDFHLLEFPHFCDNILGRYLQKLFLFSKEATSFDQIMNDQILFYNLAELMIDSQNQISKRINQIPRSKGSVRTEIYERVMFAKHYLENNFSERLSLDDISKIVGLSKYYLIKCFHQVYGRTPHNFILDLRIKSAMNELMRDHKSIQDISLEIGFADISSFSKRFKIHTGISPGLFRNKARTKKLSLMNHK